MELTLANKNSFTTFPWKDKSDGKKIDRTSKGDVKASMVTNTIPTKIMVKGKNVQEKRLSAKTTEKEKD